VNQATLFDEVKRTAVLSACGAYRYELRREWDPELPLCGWVMLNPSTADAEIDDPTIRRCVGFAKTWGAGGIVVVNLFALRATDPAALAAHDDPHGPRNEHHWRRVADEALLMVCAWGAHPMAAAVAPVLQAVLRSRGADTRCLGSTKSGAPRHPLYVKGDTGLVAFGDAGRQP
jgi:hypothetical protein